VASLLSVISTVASRYYRSGNLESANRGRLYLISIRLVYCVIPSVVSLRAAQQGRNHATATDAHSIRGGEDKSVAGNAFQLPL
jgi:hypothetical protein